MISTIITTYGGGSKLERAIDSVLSQTYEDYEVIIVDDNNPNTECRYLTENIMKKYDNNSQITYLKHDKNMNGAVARNTGIQAAKGEYISFLDDDDFYLSERFEKIMNVLMKNHNLIGIYTGVNLQDENNYTLDRVVPKENLSINQLLLNEMVLGTGSNIFVKRDIACELKGFDISFARRQDTEFMIRVCERGNIGYIPECLVIKSVNGIYSIPSYKKLKETIVQFTEKFNRYVEYLGDDKNNYYSNQYSSLFDAALYENDREEIEEAFNLIKKYRKITIKDYMRAFIHIYKLRDNKIVSEAIKLEKKLRSKKIIKRS